MTEREPFEAFDAIGGPGALALALSPAELMRRVGLDEPEAWQTEFLEGRHPRVILNCCRGSGKSTSTAVLALHEVLFRGPDALVLILSPSERQSKLMLRTAKKLYRKLGGVVAPEAESATVLEFPAGRIVSLPGSSEKTIRGFQDVSLLILDEAARLEDEIFNAATPMLSEDGRVVILSTPAGMRGEFFRIFTGGDARWHRVRITGEQSARVSERKLAEERDRMLPDVFASEYCCSFEDHASILFPTALVEGAVSDELELPTFDRPRFCGVRAQQSEPRVRVRRRPDRRYRERRGGTHYLGIDVGVVSDFTAFALLRAVAPNVLVPIGHDPDAVPWDADNNKPLVLPEGVTLAQHIQPKYETIDLQRTLGTSFEDIALEAQLIAEEIGGCTIAVDATGMGRGLVEEMRRIGMQPIAVTLGGGSRIVGQRHRWVVPSAMIYEAVFACFAQKRYRIAEALPLTRTLLSELQRCEVRRTDTGHARYGVWTGQDGHGDLLMSLGLATVAAERLSTPRLTTGTVQITTPGGITAAQDERNRIARGADGYPERQLARRRGRRTTVNTARQLLDEIQDQYRASAGRSAPTTCP